MRSGLALLVLASAWLAAGCSPAGDLTTAVDLGPEVFERLAETSPEVDKPGAFGQTPLQHAASRGDARIARYLVEHGAAVNSRDGGDMTPLQLAVRSGRLDCIQVLLDAGADVNAPFGHNALRALHIAVADGTPEVVRLLLRHGANPNVQDAAWQQTPLHWLAASDWHRAASLVPELVAAGADLSIRDARGFTPLHVAAFMNNPPVARLYVAQHRALDELTPADRSPLDLALEYRSDIVGQILADAGAKTHALHGRLPPLLEAARMDDLDRTSTLLAEGADPGALYEGQSALAVARDSGSRKTEELLLRHAAHAP